MLVLNKRDVKRGSSLKCIILLSKYHRILHGYVVQDVRRSHERSSEKIKMARIQQKEK